ncbi:trypsin CFT-1 [Helicoverpa armigera]|uniref:trypsin CFT-1 n=1 Tax=Helicoverpa armigera TaxID=29058 RepID=UPI00211355DE|nr:trypsin CFT-1 [Helicoverpa armigera]
MASLCWAVLLLAGVAYSSELGTQTSIEKYPSLAQVESRAGLLWLQQCVSSVLTSYHVLSTARCFSGVNYSDSNRRIRAGTSYRGTDGLVREVQRVYYNPSWGLLDNDGDIAVVRLETALTLGANIQQAAILGEGIYLPYGLNIQLVGWGTTAEGGNLGNSNLYELDLYTVNTDDCLETYLGLDLENNTITENMICAGLRNTQGRDLDTRDEGAPIFYSGVTVGVVSFGVSRGDDSIPIVSTNIGTYSNWIVEAARY